MKKPTDAKLTYFINLEKIVIVNESHIKFQSENKNIMIFID